MFISIIIIYTHQCFFSFPTFRQVLHLIIYIIDKRTNPNAFHNVEQVHLVVEKYSQPFHVFLYSQSIRQRSCFIDFITEIWCKDTAIFSNNQIFLHFFFIFFADYQGIEPHSTGLPAILAYESKLNFFNRRVVLH